MRRNPLLLEANARLLLRRLSARHGRELTLGSVPDDEWRELSRRYDLLWLMGVWRRSPASREAALQLPQLRRAFDRALPGWTEDDVAGSPYAVYAYELDPPLGREGELQALRKKLNASGVRLILDFVPNHVAVDHPWTRHHPEWFVRGGAAAVREHPSWFFRTPGGHRLAHGRDPNFPPWTDTAQVNFRAPALRRAWIEQLLTLGERSDGVRCDMAMLGLNAVFDELWGSTLPDGRRAEGEFWSDAIARVKAARPDFVFIAEAYWGLEGRLVELGFDFAYDKSLYDMLRGAGAGELRRYLERAGWQREHAVRFVENHDEERAAAALGARAQAAATIAATLPGLRLLHEGQPDGRRIRVPVQLARAPVEPPDPRIQAFYERLLAELRHPVFHEGAWGLEATEPPAPGEAAHDAVLAWTWAGARESRVVVVNFSGTPARAKLRPPGFGAAESVGDRLVPAAGRDKVKVDGAGVVHVELDPWSAAILAPSP